MSIAISSSRSIWMFRLRTLSGRFSLHSTGRVAMLVVGGDWPRLSGLAGEFFASLRRNTMTKKPRLLIVFVLVVALLSVLAWSQEYSLDEESAKTLNAEATKVYETGQTWIDHVDYDEALKSFKEAATLDTAHVGIRFLIAKLAVDQSKKKIQKEADDCLLDAQKAYEEIIALKGEGANLADVDRASRSLEAVKASRAALAGRDARLEKIGNVMIKEQAQKIYGEIERKKKEAAAKRAAEAATQTGANPVPNANQ